MKPIRFSQHARGQMVERGASEDEVIETIRIGERCLLSVVGKGIGRISSTIACGVDRFMRSNRFWPLLLRSRMSWLS